MIDCGFNVTLYADSPNERYHDALMQRLRGRGLSMLCDPPAPSIDLCVPKWACLVFTMPMQSSPLTSSVKVFAVVLLIWRRATT